MYLFVVRKESFDINYKGVLNEIKFIFFIVLYQFVIEKNMHESKVMSLFPKFFLSLFCIIDVDLGLLNLQIFIFGCARYEDFGALIID